MLIAEQRMTFSDPVPSASPPFDHVDTGARRTPRRLGRVGSGRPPWLLDKRRLSRTQRRTPTVIGACRIALTNTQAAQTNTFVDSDEQLPRQ
jgi:hypothetical protein